MTKPARHSPPTKIFPAMQILPRAGFAVGAVRHLGKRIGVVVLDADHVTILLVPINNLQTGRLLVLADVQPVAAKDAGHSRYRRPPPSAHSRC